MHQSYGDHDVHVLPLASQWELFIALEVPYLLTINSTKHRLFAVRSGKERTGGKWHVGLRKTFRYEIELNVFTILAPRQSEAMGFLVPIYNLNLRSMAILLAVVAE